MWRKKNVSNSVRMWLPSTSASVIRMILPYRTLVGSKSSFAIPAHVHQAKRGWWFMVRAYPAVAHLPAVVTVSRNSRGRAFYRFQVGTTSQAHSEVLCQRMETIRLSCAVVGLPWKAKVER